MEGRITRGLGTPGGEIALAYKREFKITDPPRNLHTKVTSSEWRQIREIAAGRSLSYAIEELLRSYRQVTKKL